MSTEQPGTATPLDSLRARIAGLGCPGLIAWLSEDPGGWWELDLLSVPPAWRGRGFAHAALVLICEAADAEGRELRLSASGGLTPLTVLVPLYMRHGFTVARRDWRTTAADARMRRLPMAPSEARAA